MYMANGMMKNPAVIIAVLLTLFMAANGCEAAGRPVKIGVIDIKKIIKESHAYQKAKTFYLKELEAKQIIVKTKEQEIRRLEEDLEKSGQESPADKRMLTRERLDREIEELKRMRADMDEELANKDSELTRKLVGEVLGVVKAFQQKEKYTIVMHQAYAVAFDDAVDVTDKIIELYNNTASLLPMSEEAKINATPSGRPAAAAQTVSGMAGYVHARSVNLRRKPTTESEILGKHSRGTALTILGESGDWYRVIIENKEGYLRRDLVKTSASLN